MKKFILVLFLVISFLFLSSNQYNIAKVPSESNWYKGNTHTHSTNSDGDSKPEKVVQWYMDHGYNFLIISDHNYVTETEPLDTDKTDDFILISGEEISSKNSLHLNALGIKNEIPPASGENKLEIIQKNVDNTLKAGGIPIINHPNFNWAVSAQIIKRVKGCNLFELFNGHPGVNNIGGGGFPSTEEMWDDILTSGKIIYGIASDDAHSFIGEFSKFRSNPGRGWIYVKSESLTEKNILNSLNNGNFYASTGVELENIGIDENKIEIVIKPRSNSLKYNVIFIGEGGKILKICYDNPAIYDIKGNEKYIRAKVISSDGTSAWTQPTFLK